MKKVLKSIRSTKQSCFPPTETIEGAHVFSTMQKSVPAMPWLWRAYVHLVLGNVFPWQFCASELAHAYQSWQTKVLTQAHCYFFALAKVSLATEASST